MKLFRFVLLFSAILLLASPSFANKKGEFRFGFKVLPQISKYTTSTGDSKRKFTIGGGLQIYKHFKIPVLGIESGVYILNKKGESTILNIGNINANYLSVPLLLRLHVWNFYALTGVSFDFKITESASGGQIGGVDFKTFNLGYHVGLGYEQTVAKFIGIFAEVRFNPSITQNEGISSLRFTNFGLALGVNFRIGKDPSAKKSK